MKGREKVCVEDGVKQCVARGCWQDWEFVSDISAAPYPDLTTPVKSPGNLVVHKLKRIRGGASKHNCMLESGPLPCLSHHQTREALQTIQKVISPTLGGSNVESNPGFHPSKPNELNAFLWSCFPQLEAIFFIFFLVDIGLHHTVFRAHSWGSLEDHLMLDKACICHMHASTLSQYFLSS